MPRRLRLNGLRAEISSVDMMLKQAQVYNDPIGKLQFSKRKGLLESELNKLAEEHETMASVALYFGGEPVLGSRGIAADFAGLALEQFQELVSRTYAKNELGSLGERGPIPLKQATKLMVTEVTRGSFGFVLDEFSDQMEAFDTRLKSIVEEVATLVERTASSNELEFEEVLESIDSRTLIALRDFFVNLDTNGATLKLIEDRVEFSLDEICINRARKRTEATNIDEIEEIVAGILVGFLPEHRKFEIKLEDETLIYGSASQEAADQYSKLTSTGEIIIGLKRNYKIKRRIVTPLNRPVKEVYRLLDILS